MAAERRVACISIINYCEKGGRLAATFLQTAFVFACLKLGLGMRANMVFFCILGFL